MYRRRGLDPAETLGKKAFRFGIFRNRIPAIQGRCCSCFAMETGRDPASVTRCGGSAGGGEAARSRQCCFVNQALVRLVADRRGAKKVWRYFDTDFGGPIVV